MGRAELIARAQHGAAEFVGAVLELVAHYGAPRETSARPSEPLSTAAIAKAIGFGASTLRRLAREDGAPIIRVGRAIRWDLETTRAWLAQRKDTPAAPPDTRGDPEADRIARRNGMRVVQR